MLCLSLPCTGITPLLVTRVKVEARRPNKRAVVMQARSDVTRWPQSPLLDIF